MKHKKKNEIKLGKNEDLQKMYAQATENALSAVASWLQILEQASVVHFVWIVTITTMIMTDETRVSW